MIFLMGDTVTVATPGGGTGVQLQVNLSTNDDKVSPAVRLLAAAVRPLAWEKHNGHSAEPAALSAGILPFRPRSQLWAHHGSAAGHGGTDELLGRGCPARRSGLCDGGHGPQHHRQCGLCGRCRWLLRLPLLAGMDGPCRPAPRSTMTAVCVQVESASAASGTRCGSDGPARLWPRRCRNGRLCAAEPPQIPTAQ